jgi:hypothetical protein
MLCKPRGKISKLQLISDRISKHSLLGSGLVCSQGRSQAIELQLDCLQISYPIIIMFHLLEQQIPAISIEPL